MIGILYFTLCVPTVFFYAAILLAAAIENRSYFMNCLGPEMFNAKKVIGCCAYCYFLALYCFLQMVAFLKIKFEKTTIKKQGR